MVSLKQKQKHILKLKLRKDKSTQRTYYIFNFSFENIFNQNKIRNQISHIYMYIHKFIKIKGPNSYLTKLVLW